MRARRRGACQSRLVAADPWAPLAGRFVDHYDSLYGQVRTRVLHQHLRAHAAPPPAAVVDIGGGAGHQAIPLAHEGYEVTIVDPSAVMLEEARGLLRAEPRDIASRVQLVEGAGEAARELLGPDATFDVVLCHGVVMYLDDPAPLLEVPASLAAPGGIVSVVAKNARALAIRPALERDWHATLEASRRDPYRQLSRLFHWVGCK